MDNRTLGKALGAPASYAASREVPAGRVIFCDAALYDQGYMTPESIAGRVQGARLSQGRSGWNVRRLSLRGRPHAYLLPEGCSLPFPPKGELFRID
ncbi:MAG: hypothetical protein AB1758_34565 [Candidatus Eremiobacterota bacterium]